MFTNLRMVNFKSWKDTGDVRLAPLTVLFGGNSTGKSGLLQMLLLLKQTTESSDRNKVLQTGTDDPRSYIELGSPAEIAHFDETEIGFTLEWNWPEVGDENEEDVQDRPLRFVLPKNPNETEVKSVALGMKVQTAKKTAFPSLVSYEQGRNESESFRVWFRQDIGYAYPYAYEYGVVLGEWNGKSAPGVRGPSSAVHSTKCYSLSPIKSFLSSHADLLNDLELKYEEQFRRLHYLGPLREYPQRFYTWAGDTPVDVGLRGERAVQVLLAGWLNESVASNLKELGLVEYFEVRPIVEDNVLFEVRLRQDKGSHSVLLPDVGFGVSQVLPVLVQCLYAPEHSTIILEHPDLHLHPSAQAALADFLVDVTRQRKVQLIIESHSEHLLRRLQRRTAEELLNPDDVALYFCDIQDGVSQIEELKLDGFGRISNWPDDFFGDMDGDILEVLDKGLGKKIAANA